MCLPKFEHENIMKELDCTLNILGTELLQLWFVSDDSCDVSDDITVAG